MPKLGVVGNNRQQYQAAVLDPPEQNPTLDFVMGLAQKYTASKIEEKQQTMFAAGMQRVASGEALADIKKDDPPFAMLFGPTASVAGAAAMAKVKNVDEFVTEAYQKLPELAKMDPQTAGKQMMQGMQKHMTGDAGVDAVIQTRIVEQLPVLMKAQTKANYAWVQDESSRQWSGMADAAGKTVQGAALNVARGLINEDDFGQARTNALNMLQKPDGMDDATYRKSVKDYAKLQLAQGNHWIDRWMNTQDESGRSFYKEVLSADDQLEIIQARQSAEVNTAKQYGFNQYGSRIAEIMGGAAGRSPAVNQQMVNQVNKEFMQETGSSQGIIDMKSMVAMQTSFHKRAFARQDAASEALFKQGLKDRSDMEKEKQDIRIATAIQNGGGASFTYGMDKSKNDALFWENFQAKAQANPTDAVKFLANNYNSSVYVNPQLKAVVTAPFRALEGGGPIGPELDQSQQLYTAMIAQPGGQAAADAYLGEDNAVKMDLYNRFLNSGMEKNEARQAVFDKPLVKGPKLDTEVAKPEVRKALSDLHKAGGANQWMAAVPEMDETNQSMLDAIAIPIMEKFTNGLGSSLPEAAKRAAPAIQREADILGNVVIRKAPRQDSLAQAIGASQEDAGRTMFEVIQLKAKENGVNVDLNGLFQHINSKVTGEEYSKGATPLSGKFSPWDAWTKRGALRVQRLGDFKSDDGKLIQQYYGTVTTPDGTSQNFKFTSADVLDRFEKTRVQPKTSSARKPAVPEKVDPNSFLN